MSWSVGSSWAAVMVIASLIPRRRRAQVFPVQHGRPGKLLRTRTRTLGGAIKEC
ncbi:hypothetical protein [Streptomyces sp. NPDC003522]